MDECKNTDLYISVSCLSCWPTWSSSYLLFKLLCIYPLYIPCKNKYKVLSTSIALSFSLILSLFLARIVLSSTSGSHDTIHMNSSSLLLPENGEWIIKHRPAKKLINQLYTKDTLEYQEGVFFLIIHQLDWLSLWLWGSRSAPCPSWSSWPRLSFSSS